MFVRVCMYIDIYNLSNCKGAPGSSRVSSSLPGFFSLDTSEKRAITCKSCFAASAPALVWKVTNPTGWNQTEYTCYSPVFLCFFYYIYNFIRAKRIIYFQFTFLQIFKLIVTFMFATKIFIFFWSFNT